MSGYNKSNWPRAIMVGIAAALFFGLLAYCSANNDGSSKKDDRSADTTSNQPIATREDPQDASQRSMTAYPRVTCQDLADTNSLEFHTRTKALTGVMRGGNSEGGNKVTYEDICEYKPAGTRNIVAQTSYQLMTPYGIKHVYKHFYTGKGDNVRTTKIPANELPHGITDGYFFAPVDMPADMASVYRNPGATLRVGNQLVTISLRNFDKLDEHDRKPFLDNAAVALTF